MIKMKMTVLPKDEDDCSDLFFFIKIKTIQDTPVLSDASAMTHKRTSYDSTDDNR